jgi:putative CocE/NonD family hydrolase
VKYFIDLGVTSNVFKRGHRLRLEVSSSNFPRFDRNPNTGRAIADEVNLVPAKQTIFHSTHHLSYLVLPVVPANVRYTASARH